MYDLIKTTLQHLGTAILVLIIAYVWVFLSPKRELVVWIKQRPSAGYV